MSNVLLECAIRYATELGWAVFPTREVASKPFENKRGKIEILPPKSPYLKGGFKNNTKDVAQIKEWWNRYPKAGIGISCGDSGLVVVDIDVKDGRRGFDNWMRLSLSDAGAFHAMTPSGGMHVIYSGLVNTRSNATKGVDIRSKGGYIVAPPSVLYYAETGKVIGQYTMVEDWFEHKKPPNFPSELIKKIEYLNFDANKKSSFKIGKNRSPEETLKRVRAALEVIPIEVCDDYHAWVKIGIAIKSEFGDDGFELWKRWSKKSSKYESGACEEKWHKMIPRGEVSIGTIFYYAYDKSGGL